jgi:hypothetical protein
MAPPICYPIESAFYPYHLIISFITTGIFVAIIFSYRVFLKNTTDYRVGDKAATKTGKLIGLGDGIALLTLILGIIGTGLFPTIQSPLLDYSADLSSNNPTNLTIDIDNLGLASANNVIVSVIADNVNFSNSQSTPYLADHFKVDESKNGTLFLEIDIIPPRSEVIIETQLDGLNPDPKSGQDVIPYVRSDEKVGFYNTIITSVFYLLLGFTYIFVFIYLVYWNRLTVSIGWKRLDQRSVGSIIFYIFVAFALEIIGVSLLSIEAGIC